MDHATEHDWIKQAQTGDRQAFASLVQHYYTRIYRWLYGLTHNSHTAEDLAQEVFLKAWAGLASFQPGTSFQAWLFRIAHNRLVDDQRSPRSMPLRPLPVTLVTRDPGPGARLLTKELHTLIEEACARLPALYRPAFLLRTQEGLSFAEIAQVLGATEETVRWRVFKAREFLVRELGVHLDEKP